MITNYSAMHLICEAIANRRIIFFYLSFYFRNYDWEVIIVDDSSPDGTLEEAKKLQKLFGESKIVSTISQKLLIHSSNFWFCDLTKKKTKTTTTNRREIFFR